MAIFLLFLFFLNLPLSALTITASFFNANYSVENPLVLTEDTVIELDEDISIEEIGPLFLLQDADSPITLTFKQNNTHEFQVFVGQSAVFNAVYFVNRNQVIMFEKTNLVLQDAATILLNGGKLAFFDEGTIAFSH